MARPSKMTPEVVKKIADALSGGSTRKAAAQYAGVDEKTLINWMHRYSSFSSAVLLAEAGCEVAAVATIVQAGRSGSWLASAWWLERRRHAEWGKVDRLEVEIRDAAERVAQQTGADAGWLVKRAAEIADAAARERSE
jgi:transposase